MKAAGDPRSLGALRYDLALSLDPRRSPGTDPLLEALGAGPRSSRRRGARRGRDAGRPGARQRRVDNNDAGSGSGERRGSGGGDSHRGQADDLNPTRPPHAAPDPFGFGRR
jgi:hypothetical protein